MCYNYGITTIILQPIENSTSVTTTCTTTATSVLPPTDDDNDQDGNEPKKLESADECRDDNEPKTFVQYAGGTCSKKWRDWTRQFSWPKGFSPRAMDFLNKKTDIIRNCQCFIIKVCNLTIALHYITNNLCLYVHQHACNYNDHFLWLSSSLGF